jgi:hypothetical protein
MGGGDENAELCGEKKSGIDRQWDISVTCSTKSGTERNSVFLGALSTNQKQIGGTCSGPGATNLAQFLRHTSQPRSILTGRFHQISIPTLDLRA